MESTKFLRIPEDRVGVLIGENGEVKKKIEERTNTELEVSSDGEVEIKSKQSLKAWIARNIVKAIGRGFNPEIAMKLTNDNYEFRLIKISGWANTKSSRTRLKGRVIGKDGKARKLIQEKSDCSIVVYGKTIGIIGPIEKIDLAKKAVEMLLSGSKHATVYKMMNKELRKRIKRT